MPLHICRCFQEHLRMLLCSLRALCKAPWGAWEYLEVLRSTAEGNRSVWEVCVWLPVRFTFCWCTRWTHSTELSPLATTRQYSVTMGYRWSAKKQRNGDWRAICYVPRGLGARCGVICHRGVSDDSDWAHPPWCSHSAQTEMFFADEIGQGIEMHLYLQRPVTRGFFLIVFCIYTSAGRAQVASGRWNTFQCAQGVLAIIPDRQFASGSGSKPKLLPNWRSGLSINLNHPLGCGSMVNSRPCLNWVDCQRVAHQGHP